ncbi:GNAT family N-acetyltransferase [Mammaliicoccus lentus]|uniref:GNAT family N-acetyltransferase n=1 Tax=Mammaliicoccus lentus TaxID=42858 RepID=UPI001B333CCD|nr:GNAT family N-acetyltransferase [Mammaliicoccus lentus]
MQIRNAIDLDVDALYKIAQAEGWHTFTKKLLSKLLMTSKIIVIEDNQELVGYTRFLTDESLTLYITEIIVAKEYRSQGYGESMIKHLQETFPTVRIELLSQNNQFYKKLSFRNIGSGFRLP